MPQQVVLVPVDAGPRPELSEDMESAGKKAMIISAAVSGRREEEAHDKRRVFGLCGGCANFAYRETVQDGNEDLHAECDVWAGPDGGRLRLSQSKTIKDCSRFQVRAAMPLGMMFEIATFIGGDADQRKKDESERARLRSLPTEGHKYL